MASSKIQRGIALNALLMPITWPLSSSIAWRRNLVMQRRAETKLVFPFLTKDEKIRAKKWLDSEKHEGLWD